MNTVILYPKEVSADPSSASVAVLSGHRARHLLEVLKVSAGRTIRIGVLGGGSGSAEVVSVEGDRVAIRFGELTPAPESLNLSLFLALPRPQMLKRILQFSATVGIRAVHLFASARVEKSYFGSPVLNEAERYFVEGLEQGGRTKLPELVVHRNFRTFVGVDLPQLLGQVDQPLGSVVNQLCRRARVLLAPSAKISAGELFGEFSGADIIIGPEGGLLVEEEERFIALGFQPGRISGSILRVEQAVYYALALFESSERGSWSLES